jgi:hypothetical protein
VGFDMLVANFFADPVLRTNDDRTQGRKMRIGGAAKIHGHAVEPRSAECFGAGRQFFQVSAKRFFALIETTGDLKIGRWRAAPSLGSVKRDCIEGLCSEPALVSQVKDSPSFEF